MSEGAHSEQDAGNLPVSNARLNSLRAAVLGANDGIVSVASIILGVAGATNSRTAILAAGLAGLVAGALSMAAGEYVSVSSQRDSERVYITTEKRRLELYPDAELEDLAATYQSKGLSSKLAREVAVALTEHDAIRAHLDAEFNINEDDLSSPFGAAMSSLIAFSLGGLVPLIAVLVVTYQWRLMATVIAVVVALIITGYLSASAGRAPRLPAVARVVLGGAVAMFITYGAGHIFGRLIS